MVGQSKIIEWVDNNIDSFPHFIVLLAPKYYGKRTMAKHIAHELSAIYSKCETNVGTVREVIDSSYKSSTKVMYCFEDADNMSLQAKNAMLKITEEPPENAYFCMTVCNSNSLLDTVKSRAQVFNFQPYTYEEIGKYQNVCDCPGEVELLEKYGVEDFTDYVKLVVDNIAEVEPANAFKSSIKLNLNGNAGYDLMMFFKMFIAECEVRITKNAMKYANGISVTSKYLQEISKTGANKRQLYDMWVFDIRHIWMESD